MKLRAPLAASVLALLLAAPAGPALAQERAQPQAAPARAPAGWKVGVVDLAAVFKQYRRSAELQKKIDEERERLQKDLDQQKTYISKLHMEMDALDRTSETYEIKEDEKDAAVARFDRTKRRLEERIKKRWEEYNLQLLEDIEQVVKAYGEEQSFSLILKVDPKATEETRFLAGLKAVMYFGKELDVTPAVVELLNRRYEEKQAKGGAKPAAPAPEPPAPPSPAPSGAAPKAAPADPAKK